MATMFESLRSWLTGSIQIKPFVGRNAAADRSFGDIKTIKGFFVGEVTSVSNASGEEVTSNSHFYFDPSKYDVSLEDRVIVDGTERDILTITNYMDGGTGSSSIKVVYI